jgi:L-lactate dehydrogenase complex protein LldG
MESTMSEQARNRIFARLKSAAGAAEAPVVQPETLTQIEYSHQEKIEKLKTLMEAMRTEVHITTEQDWLNLLEDILRKRKIKDLLYGPQSIIGEALQQKWQNTADGLPKLVPYDVEIEKIKKHVFQVEAGITSTMGGIADTGALILWSSKEEPRLMSLVPPIHIAILRADKIYNSLLEVMQKENWSANMPTNAFLISGPSKTADIELVLAFGVHGPKELVVLVIDK